MIRIYINGMITSCTAKDCLGWDEIHWREDDKCKVCEGPIALRVRYPDPIELPGDPITLEEIWLKK